MKRIFIFPFKFTKICIIFHLYTSFITIKNIPKIFDSWIEFDNILFCKRIPHFIKFKAKLKFSISLWISQWNLDSSKKTIRKKKLPPSSWSTFNLPKRSRDREHFLRIALAGEQQQSKQTGKQLASSRSTRSQVEYTFQFARGRNSKGGFVSKKITFVKTTTGGETTTTLRPRYRRKINWEYSFETAKLTRRSAPKLQLIRKADFEGPPGLQDPSRK